MQDVRSSQYGVKTPEFRAAKTPEEVYNAAKQFDTNELVIKAQVLAGGRGKGHFDSGLQGGVKMIERCFLIYESFALGASSCTMLIHFWLSFVPVLQPRRS